MRYTILVDGEATPVDVRALGADRYEVKIGEGQPRVVQASGSADAVHLLQGTRSRQVAMGDRGGALQLHASGHALTVTVLDARAARLRSRRGGGVAGQGNRVVRSPMPGRVVKVLVAVGDEVAAGQGVVIVEAMKMENELRAEIAGTVKSVNVGPGDLVDSSLDLVELDPHEDG